MITVILHDGTRVTGRRYHGFRADGTWGLQGVTAAGGRFIQAAEWAGIAAGL